MYEMFGPNKRSINSCKTYTNFSNNVFQNLNTNLTIILKMASRTVN